MSLDDGTIRSIKVRTEQNSKYIEAVVDQLVAKYNSDLDFVVSNIRTRIKSGEELDIVTLEGWMMEIPTFMYFAGSGLELLGIEGDNAKAIKAEAYNQAYREVEGTIPDKTAFAQNATFNEHLVEIAFQRAYKKLKEQIYNAELLFGAVKKIYTKRAEDEYFDNQEGRTLRRARREGDY